LETLPAAFFERPVAQVATDLIGCRLHSTIDGSVVGRIVEVEAYGMEEDAFYGGRVRLSTDGRVVTSERAGVLLGERGIAFVYNVFFGTWLLNVVAGPPGYAGCVLIRSAEILEGLDTARTRGGTRLSDAKLASGPGRLTRSFGIDRRYNGHRFDDAPLWLIARGTRRPSIISSTRIGVKRALSLKWRFLDAGSASVSHPPIDIADSGLNP